MELQISLVDVLSPVGFVTTAALVTGLTEVFKRLLPKIGAAQLEQQLAAGLTAMLVAAAVLVKIDSSPVSTLTDSVGLVFTAVFAWYGILRIALGIHDDATQAPNSLTGEIVGDPAP